MSLYEVIDNLQKRPEQTRKKILVILVSVAFLLLLTLWFTTFKKQIANNQILNFMAEDQKDKINREGENKAELLGPIESLKDGFGLVIEDIKEKTSEFFSQTENILGELETGQKNRPIYELPNTE